MPGGTAILKRRIDQLMIVLTSRKLYLLNTLYLVLGSPFLFSQSTATIYGRISDNENRPVEDVSISLLGLSNPPVYTDKNGNFEYKVPAEKDITVVFYNLNFDQQKEIFN